MGMILRAPDSDLPELDQVHSIADVLDRLDQIIQWSIDEGSSLGYFAVLYKRMTMSVRDAIIDRKFENPEKMAELDVAFAQQYFDALNAHFHSTNGARAPMVWTVAFVGHENDEVTIVQQMLTALNAHISLDLAMAALITAETSLNDLEPDFIMVNGLIASQISGVLDIVQELSPQLRKIRLLVPEVWLVRKVITDFRQLAWNFAIGMALQPENRKTLVLHQEAWSAALGAWYLSPPRLCIPFDSIINSIAKRENRDVTENIRKLAVIANEPAQLNAKYMRPMATQA